MTDKPLCKSLKLEEFQFAQTLSTLPTHLCRNWCMGPQFFHLTLQLTQILPKGDFNAHFSLVSQISWGYPRSETKGHHVTLKYLEYL